MMVSMMKLFLAAAAVLLLPGCGSGQDAPSAEPTRSSKGATSESGQPPMPISASTITESIAAAGGKCGALDARGEQACELHGVTFKLATDGWARQAGDRKQACAAGWVNKNYLVLTDDTWTIATDRNDDLGVVKAALGDQASSSEMRPYCS